MTTKGRFEVGERVLILAGDHSGEVGYVVKVDRGDDDPLDPSIDDLVHVRLEDEQADDTPMLFGYDESLQHHPEGARTLLDELAALASR